MKRFSKFKRFVVIELVLLPIGAAYSNDAHNRVGSLVIAVLSALFLGWLVVEYFSMDH